MTSSAHYPVRTLIASFTVALSLFWGLASAALPRPLFKTGAVSSGPDTLEVFVLYIQFLSEGDANDEATTTGLGTFGSDKDNSYTLDPNGSLRSYRFYLEKHFDFARNYFDKVSNGRVVIVPRLFPQPDGNGRITPVTLDHHMKAYNPAIEAKPQKQKIADFESQHAQAIMTFVSETAEKFDQKDSANNPFRVAFTEAKQNPSSHHYRAFLLFHAGHSRLIDGGTLGPAGANTPNDFTDFFIDKPDFKILDSATDNNLPDGKPVKTRRKDSVGVLVHSGPTAADTVRVTQFMMLSEAASQDKANWGINGILVNQLARQMGMPDLFDVVQGISQLGFFDVMDFAGYNTLNGFLPVFPSAWTRAFMGWDDPVEVPRGNGDSTEALVYAADQPGTNHTRALKIPLNEREYLLVENRQRATRDSTVTIHFSRNVKTTDFDFGKQDSVTIPYAFLDSIFLDTLCTDGASCKNKVVNARKPKGVITGASHYDIGLPGSGLLVWHVNEWFIEQFLKYGFVNAYLGDTLRSQYKGLELVEADGIPSVGKQFTDPLGQPSFDYGTAEDMFPHIFRRRKNPPKDTSWAKAETLSVIGSYGFANTNSWNDGRTHIKLEARLPSQPLYARGIGGFTGDSVFTLRDSALVLRVWWPNDSTLSRPAGSVWPILTAPAGNPQALNVLRTANGGAPFVVSAADSGMLQTFTSAGKPALAARDTLRNSAHYDSVNSILSTGNTRAQNPVPVNSIANPAGVPIGACVAKDSVLAVLTASALRLIHPNADSLNGMARSGGHVDSIPLRGMVGPLAWRSKIFVVDSQAILFGYDLHGARTDSVPLSAQPYAFHSMAGLLFGTDSQIVVTGKLGAAIRVDLTAHVAIDMHPPWTGLKDSIPVKEFFTVSTSDFDRDGQEDVFLLGSRGDALLMRADNGKAFTGYPQRFPRSIRLLQDTITFTTEDRSSPALADLNNDGHPDILFSGSNALFAVDWHGAWLPGWPFLPQEHQNVGFVTTSKLFHETVIGSTPLVFSLRQKPTVLLATPDGLIYAVDNQGKRVTYSSFTSSQSASTGVLMTDRSDWPLSVGGLSIDSARSPYINLSLAHIDSTSTDLQLLAQTASGSLTVWSLRNSAAAKGQSWLMPGGDAGRTFHLNAAALDAAQTPANVETIQEFHLFPSPVRDGFATVHLKIGAAATSARIRIFSLAGHPVKDESFNGLTQGLQPFTHVLDLSRLGPDIYSVLCEVTFADGTKSSKWERIGVVK